MILRKEDQGLILNNSIMQLRNFRSRDKIWGTKLLVILLLFVTGPSAWAGTTELINDATFQLVKDITGTVTSAEDGLPLIGVSVVVKGTTSGTITDLDGKFTLNVEEGATLVFSYTGFSSQEIVVGSQSSFDVVMLTDSELLEEVVVVGYGYRKKSHNTGAIAQVGGAEVAAIQATRVDDALAGKLAGVLIQNQDGAPGADPKIQIRAASSISGDSNPLIVVDGYPISGSLATVNPNDIESLEVLKDAASAAIYGSRGANGVILVTTKKGKSGKPSFSYNAFVSTSSRYVSDVDQLKTAGEWADILESGIADGTYDVSELDPAFLDYKINAYRNAPDVVAVEDWLFQSGSNMSHNFNMSGGSDDVNYFASVGYLDAKGIVRTQGFERYNARINVDAKLGERFKTGISANGFVSDRDIVGHDMRDLLRAYSIHPIYHTEASIAFVQQLDQQAQNLGLSSFDSGYRGGDAPFNNSISTLEPGMTAQDWHYGRAGNGIGGSGDSGPATKLDNTDRFQKTYFGNVNSYLQYSITDGLNIRTVLGADISDTQDFFSRSLEFDSRARTNQTRLNQADVKRSSVRFETFPAISLGWNVHNEAFYNSEFLTQLKLRASAGSLGTTSFLGAYNSLSLLNPQAAVLGNAFLIPSDVANPDLTWQTNTETNLGANFGFLGSRFTVGVDYYTSNIEDILINQSVSEVLGTTSIALNSGDVKSSGLELELGAALINNGGVRWNISANLSTVNTEITDLGGLDELPQVIYGQSGRGPVFRNYVGGEIGEMWGLETDGMVETEFIRDPTRAIGISSSEYYVVDQNGDGVIDRTRTVEDGGDLVKIGQNTPDFYYGLNTQVSINDFDLSMQFQGASGGDVFNIDEIYWRSEFGGRLRESFDAENDGIADHNGKFYTQSRNQLDAQVQSASYLALRNLTLGYTLKSDLASQIGLGSVRIYAASTNLLYLMGSDYTSLNPEGVETTNGGYLGPTTYGVQVGASPVVRSFTFGVDVNF